VKSHVLKVCNHRIDDAPPLCDVGQQWRFQLAACGNCRTAVHEATAICGKEKRTMPGVQLPAGKALTVRTTADAFLDSLDNTNTLRSYATGVGKTAERLGEVRPLATVPDDEIGEALELLWGTAAVNTWNARRAAVLPWLA
jgi:hypothetical protein